MTTQSGPGPGDGRTQNPPGSAYSPLDLKPVRVTRVGKCRRVTMFDFLNLPRAPSHFVSTKGSLTHRAAEMALKGIEPNWESYEQFGFREEEIPQQMFAKAAEEAMPLFEKVREWLRTTTLLEPGELIWSEERYTASFDGIPLTGRPDIHTQDKILDIKTGKKRVTDDSIFQMAGYRALLKQATGRDYRAFLVFFGEEKPREVEILPAQMDDALPAFLEALRVAGTDQTWQPGQPPLPVDVTFLCVFCPYRGVCRGI